MKFQTHELRQCNCGHVPMHYSLKEGKFYVKCSKCGNTTKNKDINHSCSATIINQWNKTIRYERPSE